MQLHDPGRRGFASDNYSGVHPDVLDAIAEANGGHLSSYGGDPYTARLNDVIRGHFGARAEAFPVFNGTGANVTALQSMLPRWGAVVCAQNAHINVDEGGAPEKMAGLKLYAIPTPDGKLTPELIDTEARGFGDEHRAQPLVVSITQSTELGTLYQPHEIKAIADHAHSLGMTVHLDGARLSNAAAALGLPFAAFTTEAGVDVLSLGGTKNGALGAEAIVVIDPDACRGLTYLRKTNMQLGSKMRFASAQLSALYEDGLWLRSASHSNAMAARLRSGIEALISDGRGEGITLPFATQSNVVFPTLPAETKARAHAAFHFYDWPGDATLVRLMCSFDTTEADVDALLAVIAGE